MSEPADYLGTKMMEDCIEYMATEESQEGPKRKRNRPMSSKACKATKAKAEKTLLDMDSAESDDSEEDEMQVDWLKLEALGVSFCIFYPEGSGLRVVLARFNPPSVATVVAQIAMKNDLQIPLGKCGKKQALHGAWTLQWAVLSTGRNILHQDARHQKCKLATCFSFR